VQPLHMPAGVRVSSWAGFSWWEAWGPALLWVIRWETVKDLKLKTTAKHGAELKLNLIKATINNARQRILASRICIISEKQYERFFREFLS